MRGARDRPPTQTACGGGGPAAGAGQADQADQADEADQAMGGSNSPFFAPVMKHSHS
jgi:hypothetical protein